MLSRPHIGARVHNDWSWANVALADPDDPWIVDGEIWLEHDVAAPWMVYRTSCVEEGFPVLFAKHAGRSIHGFAPEASDVPVWAWPGALDTGRWATVERDLAQQAGWPRWTLRNHPDSHLPKSFGRRSGVPMLPPADCAGIAAGRYTPDHIHPHTIASSNYGSVMDWVSAVGDWVSAVGDSPPESWFFYLAARIPANTSGPGEIVVIDPRQQPRRSNSRR